MGKPVSPQETATKQDEVVQTMTVSQMCASLDSIADLFYDIYNGELTRDMLKRASGALAAMHTDNQALETERDRLMRLIAELNNNKNGPRPLLEYVQEFIEQLLEIESIHEVESARG